MTEVSSKPWSDFKESDYSLEQWRRACLISPPAPSESKVDYKLPVREPSGTLNRNACHSAAGALAGARGGVSASSEQKTSAARKLLSLYRNQLEEEPPNSLLTLAGEAVRMSESTEEFLAHYGIKGMRWGVRRSRSADGGGNSKPAGPSRKEARKQTNQEILKARFLQEQRRRKFEEATAEYMIARTNKGQERAERIMRKAERELFLNPDAKTAQRMTSGEKWAMGAAVVTGLSMAAFTAVINS